MLLAVCERIEVAGSIRREKPEVNDGELVAIPRFEDGRNLLYERLDELVAQNRPGGPWKALVTDKNGHTAPRWGDDWRKVDYSGMRFDIFMTDVDSWGYQFWLRTGPGDANIVVMSKLKYAKTAAPIRVDKGNVMLGEQRVPVRSEKEFFTLLGLPFIVPKDRRKATYEKHFGKGHKWGKPDDLIPQPAPQLRLLWNYGPETLAAFPIPLDFIDADSDKMWANTTLDRQRGAFHLVEKGSREAKFQHEFLVGATQRRVEHDHLREMLWKDQELPVPGYFDIGDLPITYLMTGGTGKTERIPLANIIPTQPTVYRWGVHTKARHAERWIEWCYGARGWNREQSLADAWGDLKGIRFSDSERVYTVDGHHRFMAGHELKAAWLSTSVASFEETYAQACGMIAIDDDNTDYAFLSDVLEEALMILAEGVTA